MFEDMGVTSMIIMGRSPSSRYVSRAHRVDSRWLFYLNNLDSSISHRYVRTTEQLTSLLTKGPLTHCRWESWTRMSDNHPPPKIRGRSKHFRVILFCSHQAERVQLTARLRRAVLVTKRGKNPHTELQNNAPRVDSHCLTPDKKHLHPRVENQSSARTNSIAFFGTRRHAPRQLLARKYVKKKSEAKTKVTQKGYIEAMCERFGTTTDHTSIAPPTEHLSEGSDGTQLPERSIHLGRPRRQSGDIGRRRKPLAPRSKFRASPEENVEKSESNRPNIGRRCIKQKITCSRTQCLCVGTQVMCDELTTSKRTNAKFFDCKFHVNPSEASMQLLAASFDR